MPTADGKHVDLRRQVRLGDRHRVPERKAPPALRHHADAARALHDRHGGRPQGAQQARSTIASSLAGAVTNGSFGDRAVPLLRRDRHQRRQDAVAAASPLRLPLADRHARDRPVGLSTARRTARPTAPARCGSSASTPSSRPARFDLKAQWLKGKAPGDDVDRRLRARSQATAATSRSTGSLTPIIGLLGRGEFRDARGRSRGRWSALYITKNWRGTAGVRLIVQPERDRARPSTLHNGEYGGVPEHPGRRRHHVAP